VNTDLLHYCLIDYDQQLTKSDEVCSRKLSFFSKIMIFTTQRPSDSRENWRD